MVQGGGHTRAGETGAVLVAVGSVVVKHALRELVAGQACFSCY